MRIRSFPCVCLIVSACAVFGQETASLPAFEVATVKPSSEEGRVIGMFTYPGGRVTAANYTLKMLIHEAYAIEDFKILGGPHWIETDRYDVKAKPAAAGPLSKWIPANLKTPPNTEMRQMLQVLLADRFKLKLRGATKRVYLCLGGGQAGSQAGPAKG